MMIRIEGHARLIAPPRHTTLFHLLLYAVVTVLAQRLKVIRIEEQIFIPAMRLDMVNDGRRPHYTSVGTKTTQRIFLQLLVAKPVPPLALIEMTVSSCCHIRTLPALGFDERARLC
ncbi:hypothetical protein JOD78_003555 [Herbaspirillum sp. 1130]|nr:hypothetical protein [Herbaspirillum sp. 1130]